MAFDPGPQSETVCLEECQADSPCCTTREKGKKGKSFFPGKPKTQPENGGILYMVRKETGVCSQFLFRVFYLRNQFKGTSCVTAHSLSWYYQLT